MRTAFLERAVVLEAPGRSNPLNTPRQDKLRLDCAAYATRLDRIHAAADPAVAVS